MNHDTDNYVAFYSRARELRWTEPGSPWVEPVCVLEAVEGGPRWGRRKQMTNNQETGR